MPSNVPFLRSVLCIGKMDCLPLRYTLTCEPLAGWNVAPFWVSQRLNSLLFMGKSINKIVYVVKHRTRQRAVELGALAQANGRL